MNHAAPFLEAEFRRRTYVFPSSLNINSNSKARAMLNAALTVTSNAGSITLPGSAGATVFDQITSSGGRTIVRRVAATANTTPQTLTIGHEEVGTGFKRRIRSLVKMNYADNTTDVEDTGGVVPQFQIQLVIDRPVQSGGAITDAIVTTALGGLLHVLLASGQLAKLLNQEA